MHRTGRRTVGLALTLFLAFTSVVPPARALTVEPTVTRMTVLPGWEWLGSIRVLNEGSDEVRIEIDSINLVSRTETGEPPAPIVDEPEAEREFSLAGWLSFPLKEARIAPGSSVEIPVVLRVPQYAGHGIHRAAVAFRQEGIRPTTGGAQVATTVTSGFEVDVIGDENSRHDIRLVSFGISPEFSLAFPVQAKVRIENQGTTLGVLDGDITIESVVGFGGVSFPVATVQEGRYLRPGSAFENTYELTDAAVGSGAGLYRATIIVTNGGSLLEERVLFVVVPAPIGLALLAVLLIAFGGAKFAVRRGRRKR